MTMATVLFISNTILSLSGVAKRLAAKTGATRAAVSVLRLAHIVATTSRRESHRHAHAMASDAYTTEKATTWMTPVADRSTSSFEFMPVWSRE